MMLWPALAAGMFTLGLRPALTYTLAAQRGQSPCLILVALLLTFCTGLVAAGCGALILPFWLADYPPRLVTFAQWAMLIVPVTLLLGSAKAVLQARGQFSLYNRNHYVPPMISLVALGALAASGFLTPITAAAAILSPPLPLLIANLAWIVRLERPRLCEPARSARELLSYGLRSWGKDVIGTLATEVDRTMLIALVSPAALGLYVVAKHLARPMVALSSAVVAVLFPEASRVGTEDAVRMLGRAARLSLAVACALVLPLALAAPPLLEVLYGQAFAAAADPFRILLIDAVLVGFTSILMQAFMSSGRPGVVTALLALGLVLNVIGMLILVPLFGLPGAAFAVLISTVVRLGCLLACFGRVLQVSAPRLLPRAKDVAWLWRSREEAKG
jgi:O-antigen/teichoic acid export membrane protein